MTQVGKINFKIQPPTALTVNFSKYPGGFTHWDSRTILESTIHLKSVEIVSLVTGGTLKSAMSLCEWAEFTKKYAVSRSVPKMIVPSCLPVIGSIFPHFCLLDDIKQILSLTL